MIAYQNLCLLKEIYQTAVLNLKATECILSKTNNLNFKQILNCQAKVYENYANKMQMLLIKNEFDAEEQENKETWGAIPFSAIAGVESEHLLEIIMNNVTMELIDLTKKIDELDEIDSETQNLLFEYRNSSEEYMDKLKTICKLQKNG